MREGKPVALGGAPRVLERAEVLQPDGLHPTEGGQVLLAVLCLEAVRASRPGFLEGDFVLEPGKLTRKLTGLPAAFSVEVVDEDGNRVREGELRLDCDLLWLLKRSLLEQMALMG
ncbi:MAG: hypothetical protein HY721_07935, partial [Planctomycetes bacterium]|nr:hypothetical protein [Planctomycetota bacterium]